MNLEDIEVKDALIINTNNMETTMEKPPVDITKLSAEDKKALMKQLVEDEAAAERAKQSDREAYKELVEETVPKALFRLAAASEMLTNAKTDTYKFFEDVLSLKEKAFGIKEGQMSHTFRCETGEIQIGFRVMDGWDDTVNAGIAKVNKFIGSLAKDENTAKLVDVVFSLLKRDAKGNLKSNRVLELQKLTKEFDNEEFTDGVEIISKAFKPVRSSWFIEAALIKDNGEKVSIPLNISSVDFAAGYSFDFFNQKPETDGDTNA
ncbi:MAG: hypothetical protein C0525_01505 [Flavobacterium sp.]|uniref:DUF3164 family protein n=1 Tax=Flavobacterium sp. TaxID=239 RepID=UPI0025C1CD4A|nr:DUF3164 family protein [Flavobacterium sp.]MBA4133377.1 hypothetical protein [Flavobacterium sp.]